MSLGERAGRDIRGARGARGRRGVVANIVFGLAFTVSGAMACQSAAGQLLAQPAQSPAPGEPSAPVPASQTLVLRGREPAPGGAVVRISPAGVELSAERAGGPARIFGWDRVKHVRGELAGQAQTWQALAESAWRARTRLERGDALGAETIFESLWAGWPQAGGPTGAVIAEGLLRCRLRRGAHVGALEPWLALREVRATRGAAEWAHADWAASAGLGAVLDESTGLAPALPPIWLEWPAVSAFGRGSGSGVEPDEGRGAAGAGASESAVPGPGDSESSAKVGGPAGSGGAVGAALEELYRQAARFETGLGATMPASLPVDAGVELVEVIVRARIGDGAQRESARRWLRHRLEQPGVPAWMEAWCRAALGRSLLREDDPEARRLGLVELLHVPARFATAHPYLSGTALAEASAALEALGDRTGAALLRAELTLGYPGHPALEWPPVRSRLQRSAAGP